MSESVFDFREAVNSIERSIFGIGRHEGPEFLIHGTGFIIHEDGWIITNKHVLQPLLMKASGNNTVINPASRALQFVNMIRDESEKFRLGYANSRITKIKEIKKQSLSTPLDVRDNVQINGRKADLVIAPEAPDIGLCKIDLNLLPSESFPLRPVHFISSKEAGIGTPIGILGYPQGLQGPESNISIMDMQCCPILQTGCISSILPHLEIPNPSQFLLDIYITGGSSGSPLFTVNGDVIGVIFAAREQFTSMMEILPDSTIREHQRFGIFRGTSIGCVVPSSMFPDSLAEQLPNTKA